MIIDVFSPVFKLSYNNHIIFDCKKYSFKDKNCRYVISSGKSHVCFLFVLDLSNDCKSWLVTIDFMNDREIYHSYINKKEAKNTLDHIINYMRKSNTYLDDVAADNIRVLESIYENWDKIEETVISHINSKLVEPVVLLKI